MLKYGLKLWSINKNYINDAVEFYRKGIYCYIELYIVPGSYEKYIDYWFDLKIPFVIHAPHWKDGMNLAKKKNRKKNILMLTEAQRYADKLKAINIIVHPGIGGDIQETAEQLKAVNDERLLIENKPYYSLYDRSLCNGSSPAEIKFVMIKANVGFCLDIGHAICAANSQRIAPFDFLHEFMLLKPDMYHLADGDFKDVYDKHEHIENGNFNFKEILASIPNNARITVETIKNSKKDLKDFNKDIEMLNCYVNN